MRPKHDFGYMIKEYATDFILEKETPGAYVNGDWIPGRTIPEEQQGIILNMGNRDLQLVANGTYTRHDVKLSITGTIPIGSFIEYRDTRYKVAELSPNDEYSDFNVYFCKKAVGVNGNQ